MDPLSQAALGAVVPQLAPRTRGLPHLVLVGALAGMAPDLDVLIRSGTDPLLFLEYHRQFTHSLLFIPLGSLLCAVVFALTIARGIAFPRIWLAAFLGYATHGLLDACTSYGTLLWWPFSDRRIAWDTIAVVDPLFTLPLLAGVLWGLWRGSQRVPALGLVWALSYLLLGAWQHGRVLHAAEELASSRGHVGVTVEAKPTLGNLLLWKVIYSYQGRYYVDAIRAGVQPLLYPGQSVARLNPAVQLAWLPADTQQARDLERFRWFSTDHLAVDASDPLYIVDMRYSMLPNEIEGLWGIAFDPNADPDAHVQYRVQRSVGAERTRRLTAMLRGLPLDGTAPAAIRSGITQAVSD